MLFWFQIVFCSTQIFDFNCLVDLENSSNYLKTFKNKGLCENEEIQQKTQEMTKTVNKYLDENPFDSNFLNDLADFIEESLNSGYKNVDYDLCDFLSSINAENNLVPPSCTKSTLITNVCKNQCCTLEQSINDTKRLKTSFSSRTDTSEYSYLHRFWNNDTNLLSQKNQNDLIQEQYIYPENKTFLQKNYNDLVLLDHQTNQKLINNDINEPNAVQTDA
ncbi:hypothetical protein AAJ76_1320007276 [Vairimorpha ceranae]|uniref:Uncharacterized protein n=1 Tax=Vairimorpha ceranae TaxID=40302 RepID=A0A0F9YMQ6_9MICR|nr:hypothetical protein AAJ76_1320007276 [Vairimorpha ceranae]KKO74042.1 hypothetical protein AAJ76_1320007276 [Vairimorpha ceranae]